MVVTGDNDFDIEIARQLAHLSKLAYLPFEVNSAPLEKELGKLGFSLMEPVLNVESTQGFIALHADYAVLVFRGTQNNEFDILADLNARLLNTKQKGRVHSGVWMAYLRIESVLKGLLQRVRTKPLYFTGHSLGGAIAVLAAAKVEAECPCACYTFGAPPVGDSTFNALVKSKVHRIVNRADIVPRILVADLVFAVWLIPFMWLFKKCVTAGSRQDDLGKLSSFLKTVYFDLFRYQQIGTSYLLESKNQLKQGEQKDSLNLMSKLAGQDWKSLFTDHKIAEYLSQLG